MSINRLRALINTVSGDAWDDKVSKFAEINGRSRSSVYRWLTKGPPSIVLDAIEYRMLRQDQPENEL